MQERLRCRSAEEVGIARWIDKGRCRNPKNIPRGKKRKEKKKRKKKEKKKAEVFE